MRITGQGDFVTEEIIETRDATAEDNLKYAVEELTGMADAVDGCYGDPWLCNGIRNAIKSIREAAAELGYKWAVN